MKTVKILAIGNSFTQDPLRYLHDMAKQRGVNVKCVNLVIGGCSLERHYRNMLSEKPLYFLELNGEGSGFQVSLNDALVCDQFDIITLQQASHFSHLPHTYHPYIEELAQHVRRYQPAAKLYMQQTWAYEDESQRLRAELGFATHGEMMKQVADSYAEAAQLIGADGIIPSGFSMYRGVKAGLKMHRDTFHASLGVGRYALALTWQQALLGLPAILDEFSCFDVPVTEEERLSVRRAVDTAFLHPGVDD